VSFCSRFDVRRWSSLNVPSGYLGGVDSKVVDQALRAVLWSALKRAGFSRRTGRTAWRDRGDAVECVNVQSFNTYLASGMGATTYSFGVNLGVFFEAIATRSSMGAFVNDYSRPKEYQCHLRKFLTKGFAQPNVLSKPMFGIGPSRPSLGTWIDRPDVWLVLPDGSNVEVTVNDATERVIADGLPWFDAVSDPREAIRRLVDEPDIFAGQDAPREMYGGALGSPSRWNAIGALAAAGGDWVLLRRAVDEMSEQPYYRDRPTDLERLRQELLSHPGKAT
jgi:hypothetical protein